MVGSSLSSRVLAFDEALLRRVHGMGGGGWVPASRVLTHAADKTVWWLHGLIVWWALGLRPALLLYAASAFAAVVAQIPKRAIRRRRPDVKLHNFAALERNPDAFSFPSGHTAATVGVAVAMLAYGPPLTWVYGIFAVGVAFSRMHLGAHYPLDVLGGAIIGATVGGLLATFWVV